jgi:hypothetical protein
VFDHKMWCWEAGAPALVEWSRRAQAARNDQRILDAAREAFVADPGAPIAAVAKRAGVGIGALHRRYPSKEELLRRPRRGGTLHCLRPRLWKRLPLR